MDNALAAWGKPVAVGRPGGGNRNAVQEIRLGGQRLVARRSSRTPASLDWEAALLDHLASHGLRVPVPVPALDGRRHIAGLLDWDEARVDCTDLDLAELPSRHLPPERLNIARTAATAWEAANGWIVEPSYARHQLALLQAGHDNFG